MVKNYFTGSEVDPGDIVFETAAGGQIFKQETDSQTLYGSAMGFIVVVPPLYDNLQVITDYFYFGQKCDKKINSVRHINGKEASSSFRGRIMAYEEGLMYSGASEESNSFYDNENKLENDYMKIREFTRTHLPNVDFTINTDETVRFHKTPLFDTRSSIEEKSPHLG